VHLTEWKTEIWYKLCGLIYDRYLYENDFMFHNPVEFFWLAEAKLKINNILAEKFRLKMMCGAVHVVEYRKILQLA
jgi:hypothetical protein